ncbi:hypothetical protein [Actinomadura monticuli]|uniref:Uncharacterized protein n=1 Tax=Actinomadura monticuli TaxID=3097367 RepID=A0ABV4QLV8_9ACTN
MRNTRTAESGLEEWACPTCGRRILLRWPPHYVKEVIDAGDEQACHIASTADAPPTDPAGERRRLRETGVHALTAPVRAGLNPPEPV